MTYRNGMPTTRRVYAIKPKTESDQHLKTFVDRSYETIQNGGSPVFQALSDLGVEHYTIQEFNAGTAVEFLTSDGEPRLFLVQPSWTLKQIKDEILKLNPVKTIMRAKPQDRATPATLERLRLAVLDDATAPEHQVMSLEDRIARIERHLRIG